MVSETKKRVKVFQAADIAKMYSNIFDAYHNDSDLLAELLQNAVDSIRMEKTDNPLVEITFNQKKQSLSVKDNGIGMLPEDLEDFAIGKTKKKGKRFSSLGGEKGIGSSYIFGASDFFGIETCKDGRLTIAECRGAYDAIMNSKDPDFFILSEQRQERVPNYTDIQVTGKRFYLDFANRDEIETILRTYTAVGYTLPLFELKSLDINVKLTWVDEGGDENSKRVKNIFRHPIIDLEEDVVEYSDVQNIESGIGSFLMLVDEKKQAIGIFGESDLFKKHDLPTGIMLSVKGYPTTVEITPPRTGLAGYWSRSILILVNDDNAVLDPGRKSIRREDRNRVRIISKDIFNKLTKWHKKFIRQTETEVEKTVLESLKEQSRDLADLKIKGISFRKIPDYEQGVCAIFHELLGSKRLSGYHSLSASTDTRYDEIILYEVPLDELGSNVRQHFLESRRNLRKKESVYKRVIVVEYKLDASQIIRDHKKNLKHIDLLIAWDCSPDKLKPNWKFSDLDSSEIIFKGATHVLRNPEGDSSHVMLLKDFMKKKKDKNSS